MKIFSEYPWWFFLICILLGMFFAYLLYYNKKSSELNKKIFYTLLFLRFILTTLVAILILSPLVLTKTKELEKPLIIIAQDNSSSIILSSDSVYYKTQYLQKLNKIKDNLSKKFEVKEFSFDENVYNNLNINYKGVQTNLSLLFESIKNSFSGRNVGGIILSTDGNFNQGANPINFIDNFQFPIYCIAMGDTTIRKDILISSVDFNKTAIFKNSFPIEINILATNLSSKRTKISVFNNNNNVLFTKNIDINNNRYFENIKLFIEAKEKGIQKYRIQIDKIEDEFTVANNFYNIFVEVVDNNDKILLVYNSPNPDISALKKTFESSDNHQFEVKHLNEIDKPLKDYSLIIAYQLPDSKTNTQSFFQQIKTESIPLLMVVGGQTNFNYFNSLNLGLNIQSSTNKTNEALPFVNDNFAIFNTNKELKELFLQLPPLISPFGNYKTSQSVNTLLYQKIGNITTNFPLIALNETADNKICFIVGEGIWRWRTTAFLLNNSHQTFDELILKLTQYLTVKVDKSNLKIKIRQSFNENENIKATAELYNDSKDLINEPDINFIIKDSTNKQYTFLFSRNFNTYSLDINSFAEGDYRWEANTKIGNNIYAKKGAFTVQKNNIEALNTNTDITLLRNMAKISNGSVIDARNVENVEDSIIQNKNIKPIVYYSKKYNELLSQWWLLLLIISIAAIEWFVRKYNGLY